MSNASSDSCYENRRKWTFFFVVFLLTVSFCVVQVINETLRLGNVVRFLHRKVIQDVHYNGTFFNLKA